MSRDYKRPRNRSADGMSGSAGLMLGLTIGLTVALAVYWYDRRPAPQVEPQTPVPAKNVKPRSTEENTENKYDFYEMLPKFEVVVPEREKAESSDVRPQIIEKPGAYVLQAGSYRNYADAERMRAQLALQGIESKIQRVTVDNDTWHRIRIGPISDLAELNRTRAQLRTADVEALVIRVAE